MVALPELIFCCPLRVTVLVADLLLDLVTGLASVRVADRVFDLVTGLASDLVADRVLDLVTGLASVRVADRVLPRVTCLASERALVDRLETVLPCPCLVSVLLLTAVDVLDLVAGLVLAYSCSPALLLSGRE